MKEVKSSYTTVYAKGKFVFLYGALLTSIFSCSKEEFQTQREQVALTEEAIIEVINPNLIFEETFEKSVFFPLSGTIMNKTHGIENCNDNSTETDGPNPWTLTNSNGRGRFELRKGVLTTKGDYRSEVTIIKGTEDSRFIPDMWYSYDLMIPKDGGAPSYRKSINQWYEDGSDELTTRMQDGFVYLELQNSGKTFRWDLFSEKLNPSATNSGFTPYPVDEWHNFVFHINHSLSADGFIEVFRDGVRIHRYSGPTIHTKLPKWKLGLYASQKSSAATELIYFDNIRVGKKGITLQDMVSSPIPTQSTGDVTSPVNQNPVANAGSDLSITLPDNSVSLSGKASDADGTVAATEWTQVNGPAEFSFNNSNSVTPVVSNLIEGEYTFRLTVTDNEGAKATDDVKVSVKAAATVPDPSTTLGPISSFVLINSATEQDLLTIVDGGTYSLSALGANELNIRANAAASTGSVVFELTGPQNKTSKDKMAPFALMGDDGAGNYYHNIWDPPAAGTYTLTATTYATDYTDSASGGTSTIKFTITN